LVMSSVQANGRLNVKTAPWIGTMIREALGAVIGILGVAVILVVVVPATSIPVVRTLEEAAVAILGVVAVIAVVAVRVGERKSNQKER